VKRNFRLLAALAILLAPAAHAQETWASADKTISFTFPAGWESVDGTDYALFYGVYEDGEMTANCFAEGVIFDTKAGQTQAGYNAFIAAKTPASLDQETPPERFTVSRQVSGVTILEYAYEQADDGWPLDFSVMQFGLVRGGTTTGISFTCVGPQPMSARATRDIAQIMSSLQIKP
jgi:hypothetical protein